jgi:membrane associated rhomboid family serine protease
MGFQDREYYRVESGRFRRDYRGAATPVKVLLAVSVGTWVLQMAGGESVTTFLAATARDIRQLLLYKLVTASLAHDPNTIWPLVVNMLLLFVVGREIEIIYAPRDFYLLYFSSGAVTTLLKALVLGLTGNEGTLILGPSGSIMALVVSFALLFPNRQILFFFIPVPAWLLCVFFAALDLLGFFSPLAIGGPRWVDISAAAVAFLYWYLDLRWVRWAGALSFWRRAGRRARPARKARDDSPTKDPSAQRISQRIDELLAKISSQGKDSLTEEEWGFLRENSARYKSN